MKRPAQHLLSFVAIVLFVGCSDDPVKKVGPANNGGTNNAFTDAGTDSGNNVSNNSGAVCGDGVVEGDEACETTPSETCTDFGFVGGTLGCSDCQLDTSRCIRESCGNGTIDVGEECDGQPEETCSDQGFDGGTIACSNCLLDTSRCTRDTCGNGTIDQGEACDGSATQTCEDLGFDGGTVSCINCQNDATECFRATCGNGVIEGDETCDDGASNGGYDSCNGACSGFTGFCGDSQVSGPEECDGSNLAGQTCSSLGFGGGTLACGTTCRFATNQCSAAPAIPGPGDIVITEIMQNPSARPDSDGEWFELYNDSGSELDINGCTVYSDTSSGPESFVIASSPTFPNATYMVFARTPNIGTGWHYNYSGAINLNNMSDELELRCIEPLFGIEQTVDFVSYDDGATFPDPNGASMNLDRNSIDTALNDSGSNWCESSSVYSTGDFGTPGSRNDTCP